MSARKQGTASLRVKLCGMNRPEDIAAANRLHPDYVGFVVDFPQSHRSISSDQLIDLAKAVDKGIATVGVFVDQPVQRVAALANRARLDAVQLHGAEDDAYIEVLRAGFDGQVWKAFRIADESDVAAAQKSMADVVLLDNGCGTGEVFDHALAEGLDRPFVLAGGLDAGNVAAAISRCRPWCVDVSSGIETDGMKDQTKMAAVLRAVRCRDERNQEMEQQSPGRFGVHGGQYIPETLMNAVKEVDEAYRAYKDDPEFNAELTALLNDYCGRPSRLYFARRMTEDLGGAKVYLKREDLNHTGAHKINNAVAQCLLAKKMGKTRVIAETGAGQHGVATATAAALMGLECEVYMGRLDTERQALNVYKMELMGAKVHPVDAGTATLKDAVSETFREWVSRMDDTHYVLGSVMGPHPFPEMIRDFQAVISKEMRAQILEAEGRLPDAVLACVGGGSNAIGAFHHFIPDAGVRLIGCEAAGRGVDTAETAATLATGRLGIFHGMKSYFCQDDHGQIAPVYSISAGLDYPGVGPEHAHLFDTGRAEYVAITDDEAVDAFEYLSRTEGIIPAIESAHALAHAMKLAPQMARDQIIIVNVSGRGDKDCAAIARYRGEDIHD